jgi:hypothetical protein
VKLSDTKCSRKAIVADGGKADKHLSPLLIVSKTDPPTATPNRLRQSCPDGGCPRLNELIRQDVINLYDSIRYVYISIRPMVRRQGQPVARGITGGGTTVQGILAEALPANPG